MPSPKPEGGLGARVNGHYVYGKVFNALEEIILRNPDVEQVCVVPHGTTKAGRWLYALVLSKPGILAGERLMKDLRAAVEAEERFEEWEIPNRWRAVRFLPEYKTREERRARLKTHKSFSKFYYPGKQAPLRGERDWESNTYSIRLVDPINSVQFEGALCRVKHKKLYNMPKLEFDLRHHQRHDSATGQSTWRKSAVCRFWTIDKKLMDKIDKIERGAHVVARGRANNIQLGGVGKGALHTAVQCLEFEVLSDFRRVPLHDTDTVFERAL
jgi:hypothetical protein